MSYLLDNNVAIHLRDLTPWVVQQFAGLPEPPSISLITLIELEGGVHAVPEFAPVRRSALHALLVELEVEPCDEAIVATYDRIVQACGFSRRKILDRLIAATAINSQRKLVTLNPADFADIPDLKLESWAEPAQ